jgi:lysylphosphatidylglycerol synthetase-like protein (DUF2156 family)
MLTIHTSHSVRLTQIFPTRWLALMTMPMLLALMVSPALAAGAPNRGQAISPTASHVAAVVAGEGSGSLESAASKAGETGRKIAMSMIALGFSIASIVLAFRRDFKEAAGIFAIGLVAILLATPAGENVLHQTVNSLFGAS